MSYKPPIERLLRFTLRNASPSRAALLALDSLGAFCAAAWAWEHLYTIQLSEGPSMYPSFSVRGDYLLISRLHKYGRGIEVGDVVRFYHPSFLGVHGAKRVLGMPGDWVCRDLALSKNVGGYNADQGEEGDGKGGGADMIQVPPGHVYLVGDNLPWSRDSRSFGPVPLGLVNGKIIARVWPTSKMEWVRNPLQPANLEELEAGAGSTQ